VVSIVEQPHVPGLHAAVLSEKISHSNSCQIAESRVGRGFRDGEEWLNIRGVSNPETGRAVKREYSSPKRGKK
jgi:hypothetical protein